MPNDGLLDALLGEAHRGGEDFAAWGVAWARVLPTALFVPAFGLGVLPSALRVVIGLALVVVIAPGLAATTALLPGAPWPDLVVSELARGIPVAIAASASLWAATVAGGVTDAAVGLPRLARRGAPFGGDGTPFATLFALLAAIVFLSFGGAERVAFELARVPDAGMAPLARAARDLASGVDIGALFAAPLLIVALATDLAVLLVARELPAWKMPGLFASAKALVVLVFAAAFFERMAEAIARATFR